MSDTTPPPSSSSPPPDPADWELAETNRRIIEVSRRLPIRFDADTSDAWAALAARTKLGPAASPVPHAAQGAAAPVARRMPTFGRRVVPIATAFAAGIILALAGIVVSRAPRVGGSRSPAVHEYATASGQRETVTLSDGTRFTLAPASRLRVPVDYAAGNRVVALDGQAFFAVVHDAAHPFAVRTATAVATDVGTAFDVRAYANDPVVRVVVAEGRVSIHAVAGGSGALARGDVASVTDSGIAVTHGADVTTLTAWTQGVVSFVRTPFGVAAPALSRWYDLDVRIADSALDAAPLTAAFRDESPTEALDAIALVLHARYERRGRVVTFTTRRVK